MTHASDNMNAANAWKQAAAVMRRSLGFFYLIKPRTAGQQEMKR